MTGRRFPAPWTVEKIPGGFKVLDANQQSLAYVYARETPDAAHLAKVLTEDEARRIAANIAKLPSLLASLPSGPARRRPNGKAMKRGVSDADREASLDATDLDLTAQAIPADRVPLVEPRRLGECRLRGHDKRGGRDQACVKSSCLEHVNHVPRGRV
jgi:hypothetical protein